MVQTKKQMFIVIGVFALVMMLGTVTYAFFNYTRTGTANNIRTGQINFLTTQSNTLNLTNVFPMSATDAGNANLDAVSLRIQGSTTYSDGEEYEITLTGVNNTVGTNPNEKTIPINYIATYSATPVQSGNPNVIGESSNDYFTDRGSTTAVYQLSGTGEATNGAQVLVGYIPANVAIDGTLTIKAYLDSSKIVISDTYPSGTIRTVKTTNYSSSNCETALTGVTNASTYCATAASLQSAIDNENLTEAQITLLVNAGIVEEYTNGTPASFGEGKTVLTTEEWNSLQNIETPLSFKIKAESQEGTWVEKPATPASCFDKKIYHSYTLRNNLSSSELSDCVTYISDKKNWSFDNNGTATTFCQGTGTYYGETFQNLLDASNGSLIEQDYSYFINHNIITDEVGLEISYYDSSCGSDVVIPRNMEYTRLLQNENIQPANVSTCVNYFSNTLNWTLDTENGETWETYCNGTGTRYGSTFQERLDRAADFTSEDIAFFKNNNIVVDDTSRNYPVFATSNLFGSNINSISFNDNLRVMYGDTIFVFYSSYPSSIIVPASVRHMTNQAIAVHESSNGYIIPDTEITIMGNPYIDGYAIPAYSTIRYGGTCQELKRSGEYIIYGKNWETGNPFNVITSDTNACEVYDYSYD